MAGVIPSPAEQRLAASRQRVLQALHAPAATAPLAAQIQALCTPSIQRHPWRWVLGALASGGALAAAWKRLPRPARALLLHTAQTLGQESLLAWWLAALRPRPAAAPEASPAASGLAPAPAPE